jgi:hypothetical protein
MDRVLHLKPHILVDESLGANRFPFMFCQIKHMLADSSDGSRSVGEQELPVGFIVQCQKF